MGSRSIDRTMHGCKDRKATHNTSMCVCTYVCLYVHMYAGQDLAGGRLEPDWDLVTHRTDRLGPVGCKLELVYDARMYVHTYIYIYIHTCTYIYIYIHMQ